MEKQKLSVADIPHMNRMWDRDLNTENPGDISAIDRNQKHWKCPECGCTWSASPRARYRGSGLCPCHDSNKIIKQGVNDVMTIVPEFSDFLDTNNDFDAISHQGIDSSLVVNYKCKDCGRTWSTTIKTQVEKKSGNYTVVGCPHYNTLKRKAEDVPVCADVEKIFRFWDENNELDPTKTPSNASDRAHFICKNCGHDWNTSIRQQARSSGKCNCCELQHVVRKGFTDVFTLIPTSKMFYNFERNEGIDIYSIPLRNTDIPINWKCPVCGNEWVSPLARRIKGKKGNYSFAGCQKCYLDPQNHITPVSSIPKLVKYWDFELNKDYDITKTSAHSTFPVHWHCEECGHKWFIAIKSFNSYDYGCPACAGKRGSVLQGRDDVLTLCPELASIYDFDTNARKGINIYSLGPSSRVDAHFKCKKCGNDWDSLIANRVREKDGVFSLVDCPKCSNKNWRSIPYSVQYPLLADMYDDTLNTVPLDSIRGYDAILNTYYHWNCLICGAHFESTLGSMVQSQKFSTHGCPYCANTKVRKGESFADLHPDLMEDYDPNNTTNPYDVAPGSKQDAKWICHKCGFPWKASFSLRHMGFGNCPVCNRTSHIEEINSFAAVYPDLASRWSSSNEKTAKDVYYNSSERYRFICPDCGGEYGAHIDEFLSDEHHHCPYCKGIRALSGFNSFADYYPELTSRWSPNNTSKVEEVRFDAGSSFWFICPDCGGEYGARIGEFLSDEHHHCPYCKGKKVLPGYNSFAENHPELLDELYSIANYLLPVTPDEVLDSSTVKFWWTCKKDGSHHYQMSPSNRLMFQKRNHESCLYCRGQRRKLNHFIMTPDFD